MKLQLEPNVLCLECIRVHSHEYIYIYKTHALSITTTSNDLTFPYKHRLQILSFLQRRDWREIDARRFDFFFRRRKETRSVRNACNFSSEHYIKLVLQPFSAVFYPQLANRHRYACISNRREIRRFARRTRVNFHASLSFPNAPSIAKDSLFQGYRR